MMKSEFDNLLGRTSTQKDYDVIEFVYNYHPCNFTKEAVANLYKEFGLIIFEDMIGRATEARDLEEELQKLRAKYQEVEAKYRALGTRKEG